MEELFRSSALLLIIVTLLYVVITGITMTERKRVMLVYIFAYVIAMAGAFQLRYVVVGSVTVLILAIEFLTDDARRLQLLTRLDYKIVDFLYRSFVEYGFGYFLLSVWAIFAAHLWQSSQSVLALVLYGISLVCVAFAVATITSQKYSTKSITTIMNQIEGDMLTYQLTVTPHMRELFAILVGMEDREFFKRNKRQHTIPFKRFINKAFSYIHTYKGRGVWQIMQNLRGYGTIEMQLLRSIGIEFGYDEYKYRRKIFELLYANMLFNSYLAYLKRARGEYSEYREYIIRKYIDNVSVKLNGHLYAPANKRSSLLRMFNKHDVESITKEEFFVWCLALPHTYIYPGLFDYYNDFMRLHNINPQVVERLATKFN